MSEEKQNAYKTMYYVLVCTTKLFAPVAPIISEKIYKVLTDGLSVHLAQWTELPKAFEDKELLSKVALVQEVIYLARSIRNKNHIKNRQPLSSLKMALPDISDNGIIEEFKETITEELNVKNIELLKEAEDIAQVKYNPDFNQIRSRYPDRIAEIIKTIKSRKFHFSKDTVTLKLNTGEESFDKDIILVTYQAKDGQHVASNHGIVVSLDLAITEELKEEGFARDIVRNIQDARKQMGCEITDGVFLAFKGSVPEQWLDYICRETLGTLSTVTSPENIIEINDGKEKLLIQISKA